MTKMSVGFATIPTINLTKGHTMCATCNAIENGIRFYSVKPMELCETHFFEWQEEKMYMELDRSTEGIYA
jgi:hypothetical protein